jgi:2-haloacid dehalogenase
MRTTIVFDVNETLLDLSALDGIFARHFGNASVRRLWFSQVLQSALLSNVLEEYRDFGAMAAAALEIVAARSSITLSTEARQEILGGMRALPAHPEARNAVARLKQFGCRLATLTNSSFAMVHDQLRNSGLSDLFDVSISVDKVRCFKPARVVYEMAAAELGEDAGDLWLVAAHNWDTTGALRAGWKAAFVQRPGMVLGPLDKKPQVIGRDLSDVADNLIATLSP